MGAIILEYTARFLAHISVIFVPNSTVLGIVVDWGFFTIIFPFPFFFPLKMKVLFINAYQDWVFLEKSLLLSVTLYNHAFSSSFFNFSLSANACLSAVWHGEEPLGSVNLVWRTFSGQKNMFFLHPCPITKLQPTRKENFVNQNSQLGNH